MLAEKITILMDKDKNIRMGLEARRLAENFSLGVNIEKTLKLYQSLLSLS
jgi:glycosyltransferase involved in cell wall biosynthesis